MSTKADLLKKYDGANQDTKQAIIKHLWRYPNTEHNPEDVYRAVKDDCRAGEASTIANRLSELADEDAIKHESRSYYQWVGQGRPRPNSRLREVRHSFEDWLSTLNFSYGTLLISFTIWVVGLLSGIASLIALISSYDSFLGITYFQWFISAGTMTIVGSFVVMIWIPLYLLDVARLKDNHSIE